MEDSTTPYGRIYVIHNTVNNKMYVGQTTTSVDRRWRSHSGAIKEKGFSHLHAAIRTYGRDKFTVREIATADNQERLNHLETLWINILNTSDREVGYNLRLGGANGKLLAPSKLKGRKLPEEIKQKLRGRPRSEESKARMRAHIRTEKHRKNLSEARKRLAKERDFSDFGRRMWSEYRDRMKTSSGCTWKLSEETKKKMRKPKSPEHRAKLAALGRDPETGRYFRKVKN